MALMPDVTPTASGHQWHMRFDRVVCRDCDAVYGDDDAPCPGTKKIRPQAGIRQQEERT
jgi:hypothetical protein